MRSRAPGLVGNLPRALSSFVGRELAVADLARDVSTSGLLTLVGVGGIGKTRLALAVASALREQYAHGAWLVELAPVADPTHVAGAVAAALGIRERPGWNPLETLGMVLGRRQLLLVLDNCEHVLQSTSELVAMLLQSCDNLSVLATSREPLGVPGEILRTVPPLSIPSLSATADEVAESDAVQLFVERVQASRSGFSLTPQAASVAGQICRRLDGLPLAIELAAARAKSMSLAEIASRLDDPLGLLTGGPRAAPRRHQALRAAIDWSFDLLSDPERKLLRRVAIFNGGFTVDSARQVCCDAECPSEHVVDLLDRLVNQSFVNVDTRNDKSRFTMLETLRQYALERLEQAGEAPSLRERYRDWCLELVSRVPPEVFDPGQVAVLEPEIENLISALRWAIETEQVQDAARLSIGIVPWWFLRGSFAAGRAALISVLDLAKDDPTQAELPQVALLAAQFAGYQGDYDAAESLVHRAQAFALTSRGTDAQVFATTQLGWLAFLRGDARRACDAQSRALSDAPTDGYMAQLIRFRLAIACIELGELARAQQLIDTMRDRTTTESRFLLYRIQKAQAMLAERAGDYVEADRLLDDSLMSERAAGEQSEMIETLTFRGIVALERGERQLATDTLAEALEIASLSGSKMRLALLFEALATLVVSMQPAGCVRLAAAAEHLRKSLGAAPLPTEQARVGRCLETAKRRLGDQPYVDIWLDAQKVPLDASLAEARLLLRSFATSRPRSVESSGNDALSDREREVAILVARGLTNRQIADELIITRKTVETHVSHMLAKLGLVSRVQIATWGLRHGGFAADESGS